MRPLTRRWPSAAAKQNVSAYGRAQAALASAGSGLTAAYGELRQRATRSTDRLLSRCRWSCRSRSSSPPSRPTRCWAEPSSAWGAGEDDAGGVLLAGGDVAALWVTVAVLWAGLIVFAVLVFFAAWCSTVRSAGLGTVAIEATVALPC